MCGKEITMGTITSMNELAGVIVALITILSFAVGVIAWFLRLEFRTNQNKTDQEKINQDFQVLETKMETKIDALQNSMNTVLVTMGEIRGGMGNR